MRLLLFGLLLVGCGAAPPLAPRASTVADPNRGAFAELARMPGPVGDCPTSKLLRDYAPTPTDLRRFLWTGEALTFSHGHRLTPAIKAFIWKNLDRYPEFTRDYVAVFPDEYLDRAARDPEFEACYEEDYPVMPRDLPYVLDDLRGDVKFLRGRLHGAELRKYLTELKVQQLKVVVSRAFLRLSPQEQAWCIQSLQQPKHFPGTSSCGTENLMLEPILGRLAIKYATWAPRCLRFLARPDDKELARQLSGEYLRLARYHASLTLAYGDLEEMDPHLLARALLSVAWSGRTEFEKVLSEWPEDGMLQIQLDPETGIEELARVLRSRNLSRVRRVYLRILTELAQETDSEAALTLLIKYADRPFYSGSLPIPSEALREECKDCLRTSLDENRIGLALDLLVEAGDTSAIPLVRALDKRVVINRKHYLFALGARQQGLEAAKLYEDGDDDWALPRRDEAQLNNALFEELVHLWNRRPKDGITQTLLNSPCDATDRWLVQQLLDKPDPKMLAEASRRRSVWRGRNDLLQRLANRSGSLRGLHSLLCGQLSDISSVLQGEDEDAALALLAGATYTKMPLPLEPLAELARRNALLRRAVLSYLVRVEGPEARRLLREYFGEGRLPGMLGSQSFQNDTVAIRKRLRLVGSDDVVLALVTREATFLIHEDSRQQCRSQMNSSARRACPEEIAQDIFETVGLNENLLFNRLDGPGSQEMLLVWKRYGRFRQAYFSDPDPATPQGQMVLHLLDRLREVCTSGSEARARPGMF